MKQIEIRRFPTLKYACAEAINTLCTNLTFSGSNIKKIVVTSSHEGEGKTQLSLNIARTLASLGYRVALVDADLRRSVLFGRYKCQFVGDGSGDGLAQYLAGMVDANGIIYETNLMNVYLVPIGRNVNNSLQLLNSPQFADLLNELSQQLDYVIVDAAPVGQVIDAAQIAKSCDGILLAVKYNSVRRQELIDVRDQLMQTGCPILGAVLTQVSYDAYVNKKYYYAYQKDEGKMDSIFEKKKPKASRKKVKATEQGKKTRS